MIINSCLSKITSGGEIPTLNAPTISINNTTLTITPSTANIVGTNYTFVSPTGSLTYKVYSNGTLITTTTDTAVDLSSFITEDGTYAITVKSTITNYNDSASSEPASYVVSSAIKTSGKVAITSISGTDNVVSVYLYKKDTSITTVSWGDGETSTTSVTGNTNVSHNYSSTGTYTITVDNAGDYYLGNTGYPFIKPTALGVYPTDLLIGEKCIGIVYLGDFVSNTSINFPITCIYFGKESLKYVSGLTTVVFASSSTNLGKDVFSSTITSITIPKGTTLLDSRSEGGSFQSLSNGIVTIYYMGTIAEWTAAYGTYGYLFSFASGTWTITCTDGTASYTASAD